MGVAIANDAVLRLLPCSLSVIDYHLGCDILLETDRRRPTGLTVGAAASAHSASTIHTVRTRTVSLVARDGLFNDLLPDLGVGLRGLCRLGRCKPQRQSQKNE